MADIQTANSRPFMIELPSGTKLYGFTGTTYIKENGVVKPEPDPTSGSDTRRGSRLLYWTEVPRSNWRGPNEDAIQYAAPGTGSPKFYHLQGSFVNGKWFPTSFAGLELEREFAKFEAGKPTQISTVVATGPKAVALATGAPEAGLAAVLFNPNVAGGGGGGGGGGNGDPQPTDPAVENRADVDAAVTGRTDIDVTITDSIKSIKRTNYGNYYYPESIKTSTKQDRIKFSMKYIEGSTIKARLGGPEDKTITRKFGSQINGSVTLPIQPGISDSNSVDWSGGTLNAIQAAAAAASMKLITSDSYRDLGENAGRILGSVMKEFRNNSAYGTAMNLYFAQEAVGAQNLLSRATGAVLNPNLELLFNGPSLRSFNFTFRLSPRDENEAKQVRNIIRFFKQGMSVKKTSSEVFLKSPNVFDIEYQTYDEKGILINHQSLNRIKTCALLSCDVNYTPDGTYMTFDDATRTMTSYELSLRFSELDPIYDDDYTKLDSDNENDLLYQIGY